MVQHMTGIFMRLLRKNSRQEKTLLSEIKTWAIQSNSYLLMLAVTTNDAAVLAFYHASIMFVSED